MTIATPEKIDSLAALLAETAEKVRIERNEHWAAVVRVLGQQLRQVDTQAHARGLREGLERAAQEVADFDASDDFNHFDASYQLGASKMRQLAVRRIRSLAAYPPTPPEGATDAS